MAAIRLWNIGRAFSYKLKYYVQGVLEARKGVTWGPGGVDKISEQQKGPRMMVKEPCRKWDMVRKGRWWYTIAIVDVSECMFYFCCCFLLLALLCHTLLVHVWDREGREGSFLCSSFRYNLVKYIDIVPVVPHKAVAEVSKIGNL